MWGATEWAYKVEFFEKPEDAKRFAADPVRARFVLAVYDRKVKSQRQSFYDWLDDALAAERFGEYTAAKMTACVVW